VKLLKHPINPEVQSLAEYSKKIKRKLTKSVDPLYNQMLNIRMEKKERKKKKKKTITIQAR